MSTVSVYFRRGVSAEFLKLKNTLALWLTLAGSMLPVGINFLVMFLKGEELLGEGGNAWQVWLEFNMKFGMFFLMPFYLILINALVNQVDHKNNTHKLLYSFSIPKSSLYYGRALMAMGLYTLCFVLFVILLQGVGSLLGIINPALGFEGTAGAESWWKLARSFLGGFGILGIQFWMSYRWKNLILPLGIGVGMMLTTLFLTSWEYSIYIPYLYPFAGSADQHVLFGAFLPQLLNDQVILSLSVCFLALTGGYLDARGKDVL